MPKPTMIGTCPSEHKLVNSSRNILVRPNQSTQIPTQSPNVHACTKKNRRPRNWGPIPSILHVFFLIQPFTRPQPTPQKQFNKRHPTTPTVINPSRPVQASAGQSQMRPSQPEPQHFKARQQHLQVNVNSQPTLPPYSPQVIHPDQEAKHIPGQPCLPCFVFRQATRTPDQRPATSLISDH